MSAWSRKSPEPAKADDLSSEVTDVLLRLLPDLSKDLCQHCLPLLESRISELVLGNFDKLSMKESTPDSHSHKSLDFQEKITQQSSNVSAVSNGNGNNVGFSRMKEFTPDSQNHKSLYTQEKGSQRSSNVSPVLNGNGSNIPFSSSRITSWADAAAEEEEDEADSGAMVSGTEKRTLSRDEREYIRFMNVGRKKDFVCFERVRGKSVNILQGLELHTEVFSAAEQRRLVDFIYQLQESGRRNELRERTYSEPKKWMRGKGRVTIQFGCCYNYATDRNGNPPGILRAEEVDPIPPLFKTAIKRLVRWQVLPPSCVPDSCIVNMYDEGDCIPPHIDHHDFVRPFCTVSLLSECNIIFGSSLKILGPGEFAGSTAIPLPVGSVLILNGNGADIAKHSVPAVPSKRISITFRKMDPAKLPFWFVPEPDLQNIEPLTYQNQKDSKQPMRSNQGQGLSIGSTSARQQGQGIDSNSTRQNEIRQQVKTNRVEQPGNGFALESTEFPPLHGAELKRYVPPMRRAPRT